MTIAMRLLCQICSLVDQPLLLINSRFDILQPNNAFCELIDLDQSAIVGRCVFDLPDGRWNGGDLRRLLDQHESYDGEFEPAPPIEWALGTSRYSTARVRVIRLRDEMPATAVAQQRRCKSRGRQKEIADNEIADDDAAYLIAIYECSEAKARLAKHADMAKLLYRAMSLASTGDSLEQTLAFCVYAVCELTGWPAGHFFLTPSRDDQALISTGVWRHAADFDITRLREETERIRFVKGVGLPGRVWESQNFVWMEDILDLQEWVRQNSIQQLGVKAAFGFPIRVAGETRAVLEFFNNEVTPQSDDIVMFCNHLSEPVGRVIERRENTARLQEAKDAFERASRAKSRFLANISHELRTPLTSILGMLHLTMREDLPEPIREYMKVAEDSANSLLSLLNDILDFAGLETERMEVVAEPFALRELLHQAVDEHRTRAREKGLRWRVKVDSAIPDRLMGDPVRLGQVVRHLVDNAVKFTTRGEIDVRISLLDRTEEQVSVIFAIRDTGPGLAAERQREMMEGFTQADSSFTRAHGGAGLGLALSRGIIERLGGELSVDSQIGVGSTFSFHLPFIVDASRVSSESADSDERIDDHPQLNSWQRGLPPAESLTILLAEDTPANQKVITKILEQRGHRVSVACNGREAIEMVAHTRFDMILMDLQMPVMDGYQATATIREIQRLASKPTPIIGLTAHATERDREACLQAGMDAYLSKPIDVRQLIETVEGLSRPDGDGQPRPVLETKDDTSNGLEPSLQQHVDDEEPAAMAIDLQATRKRLGGDEDLLREFIEVFNEDAPQLIESLRTAIRLGDSTGVKRSAHSLRGLAANFNAESIVKPASQLERAGKQEDLERAEELLEQLEVAVTRVTGALKKYSQT